MNKCTTNSSMIAIDSMAFCYLRPHNIYHMQTNTLRTSGEFIHTPHSDYNLYEHVSVSITCLHVCVNHYFPLLVCVIVQFSMNGNHGVTAHDAAYRLKKGKQKSWTKNEH